jgi:phage I-like protein
MKHALKSSASILNAPPIALSAVDATPVDGATGNWIKLMPAGTFSGRTGRGPFIAGDRAGLAGIVSRTRKRAGATDLVVDYDHQTVFSAVPGVGGRAPAAGWIKELDARPDGIWGRVEWTPAAADAIRAGEYRYISPAFSAATPTGGKVSLLVSAGLTNVPDLDLAPIAASAFHPEETETDMKSIAKALGLPEEATEAEILAAMSALVSFKDALVAASGVAKPEDAVAVITTMRTASTAGVDPAKFVPIEQVTAMQADIKALQASTASASAEADVSKAIADGKIMPALKEWALDLHKSNIAAFNAYIDKSPILTASQRIATTAAPAVIEPVLDDADLLVMSQLGLSKEQMLKSKKGAEA